MSEWKVTHYPHNPKGQVIKSFSSRADAMAEAHIMQSDDPDDPQCTYIENGTTGEFGKRTWGKRKIEWSCRGNRKAGTKPDTSLYLGDERRAWLKQQEGIQPTIQRLIDGAMHD